MTRMKEIAAGWPGQLDEGFEKALVIALNVHGGKKDRAGEPYILHPLRVALRMETPLLRSVAVLHDTLEDVKPQWRGFARHQISAVCGPEVLELVELLSRGVNESYRAYIERLLPSAGARAVKLADLADNLDMERQRRTGYDLPKKLKLRYLWARWILEGKEALDAEPAGLCKNTDTEEIDKNGDGEDSSLLSEL